MPQSLYFDFDLLIERGSAGYRATVLSSPAGEANVDFKTPFTDDELEIFLLRLGRRRTLRGSRSSELETAKDFGTRLFDAVFQGEVRGCFRSSLDQIERQRGALRLRLRFADAPELADLPWEYLYYAARKRFLAISSESPVVRYIDLPEPITPLAVVPPLRILTMISSPVGYPELDVEREFAKLREALKELEARSMVTLERLQKPTLSGLQRQLRRGDYHIFHFIGHGAFDPQSDEGVLVLENEQAQPRLVGGSYLGAVLRNERSLRLAILNSCEGARGSRIDPYGGTAQNLVQQGIPAVIAMQFEISDQAAIIFAQEFYSALADGFPVDAALTEARLAIFSEGNDTEWGTPVLYLRSPDGHIFKVEDVSEGERKRTQIEAFIREANDALAAEEFDLAEQKLMQVLSIAPNEATAITQLEVVRRQKQASVLYCEGLQHYDADGLNEARDCFLKTQTFAPHYKDVDARLAGIEARKSGVIKPMPAVRQTNSPIAPAPSAVDSETEARAQSHAQERHQFKWSDYLAWKANWEANWSALKAWLWTRKSGAIKAMPAVRQTNSPIAPAPSAVDSETEARAQSHAQERHQFKWSDYLVRQANWEAKIWSAVKAWLWMELVVPFKRKQRPVTAGGPKPVLTRGRSGMAGSAIIVFAVLFLALGILDAWFNPAQSAIYILCGIIALLCRVSPAANPRVYFKIIAIVYAILAMLGFVDLLGMISNNEYDTLLHTIIALLSLFFGLDTTRKTT